MKRTMKNTIEKILEAHGILDAFSNNEHYYAKIEAQGFMPLSIEKHGSQRIVSHYFEQNGDLVPDPDMEFVDLGGADWLPVAIQHSTRLYCRASNLVDGKWKFNLKIAMDLQSFARMWGKNLIAQGFARGRVVQAGPA
jgi:hypothetical protein